MKEKENDEHSLLNEKKIMNNEIGKRKEYHYYVLFFYILIMNEKMCERTYTIIFLYNICKPIFVRY